MFDTIHMSVPFSLNHDDEIIINDDFYIKYNPNWNRLMVNVSIPKLLYGNNIAEINENDIDRFFNIVHKKINDLFHKEVDREHWQVYRLDFSKNFKLENQKQVTSYIHNLSKIKLSRKQTITYGQETVSFKNRSQIVNFYDKLAEMKHNKVDNNLLEQSKNVLRFEIQCKKDVLKQYTKKRKAVDLLTNEMYQQVMNDILERVNTKLENIHNESDIDPALFDIFTYSKLEKIYAFSHFIDELGESFIRAIYDKSFYNRQSDLKKFREQVEKKQKQRFII
jgi:hypothetical protein